MTEEFYRWLKELIKSDKMVKFYQCPAWRKVRKQRMKLDNYECQRCKAEGKYTHVQNVHHIKEVKKFPLSALDLDNTECICIQHHNEEHDRYVKGQGKKEKSFNNFDSTERW